MIVYNNEIVSATTIIIIIISVDVLIWQSKKKDGGDNNDYDKYKYRVLNSIRNAMNMDCFNGPLNGWVFDRSLAVAVCHPLRYKNHRPGRIEQIETFSACIKWRSLGIKMQFGEEIKSQGYDRICRQRS